MSYDETPLCVDLDGTVIRTDSLVETFLHVIKRQPGFLLQTLPLLVRGKAALKEAIARRASDWDATTLPYNDALIERLRKEHDRGRHLVLVTAADRAIAEKVAAHLGLFDEIMASDGSRNLKGEAKARMLVERFGEGGFDYIGDHEADLAVWRHAREIGLVDPDHRLRTQAEALGKPVHLFIDGPRGGALALIKAMRPHQWAKNVLIFVPLLAAHAWGDPVRIGQTLAAFVAFSLLASSVYLLNDLLDLSSDRAHHSKRHRPFASGAVPLIIGLATAPALLLGSLLVAMFFLPPAFLGVLAVYYALTLAYSFWLKQVVMVDVLLLAALYTMRIIAGAAAVTVPLSFWLLAFSMFLFLSLAMIKRYVELDKSQARGQTWLNGRGYAVSDLPLLTSLGGAAGYLAVLVLALYINSPEVHLHYAMPRALWLLCPLMLYWVSRMWMQANRGNMNDDPVVFALKDRISLIIGVLTLGVVIVATLGVAP